MLFNRKRRTERDRADAGRAPRQEVDRLIAKERYKEAVKQAKICYRNDGTAEHHQLLERAYLLRAEQLRRGGMSRDAREVAHHLVEFGVTDPELIGSAADLLVAVGMSGPALELQGRLEEPEARDRLLRQAADQAVLHPDRASGAPPEVLEGASRVREALEAMEAGDEDRARSALSLIARSSPFSDWKLFVRGLAAARRHDLEERRACWARLDPDRAPKRIAVALQALDGCPPDASASAGAADPDAVAVPRLEAIERQTFGEPVLGPLRKLGTLVAQDRWAEAVRVLRTLRPALRRIDPALADRLTRVLYDPLVEAATRLKYTEARRLIRDFTSAAEPLPIDPRWNRLWALAWEGPQGSFDEAEPFWRKYLKDLESAPALSVEERAMARGLVWKHLGCRLVEEAEEIAPLQSFGPPRLDAEIRRTRRRAVECLEESLRLCPTHRATYQVMIDAYQAWDQPDEAAAVGRRLLEVLPDDFDTLMDLAVHHFRRDDPTRSIEYAQRGRALKPLDQEAASHEWAARVTLARQHALKRRFDEARAELEAAERLRSDSSRSFHFLARKVMIELKAGRDDRADDLIAEARRLLDEPAPLWLALLIEARRYKLSKAKREPFETQWAEEISKKRRSETAGALADLLSPFLAGDVNYTGRQAHVKQVVDYLRRTTRLKYRPDDLVGVCGFLGLLPGERKLFETLVKRGAKHFPDVPEFPMMLGAIEMEKGPFQGDLRAARRHFEQALELAEARASTDPKAAGLVSKLRKNLTRLEDLAAGPMGIGSPFGRSPFDGPSSPLPDPSTLPPEVLDMINAIGDAMGIDDDDLFGDDFDDESEDEGPPPPRPPGPGRQAPKKKRKKR